MNPYILWVDKVGKFECTVDVKGASTKNAIARLIAETKDLSVVFSGKIESGKCIIPIRKLKGIFESKEVGNIRLEIIVEDTYFTPWQSPFVVETEKSVEVGVADQTADLPSKPLVEVSNIKSENKKDRIITVENVSVKAAPKKKSGKFENDETALVYALLKNGINKGNLANKKKLIESVVHEFFSKKKSSNKEKIVKEAIQILKTDK